jgi:hypothetical protein
MCAESLGKHGGRGAIFDRRAKLIRELGEVIDTDPSEVAKFLSVLSPEDTYELMRAVVPALQERLAPLFKAADLISPRRATRGSVVPDDLPTAISDRLVAYKKRYDLRYERLVKNGHTRSHTYIARLMSEPLRLARFLTERGFTSWEALNKREIVAFMEANPTVKRAPIDRFERFLTESQPFRSKKPAKTGMHGVASSQKALPPAIMSRDELKAFLENVRATRSEPEYLLAWLVCRMGMMAEHAFQITLDRFNLNESGRLVIKPATAWVIVPRNVAACFEQQLDAVFPSWRSTSAERRAHLGFFRAAIRNFRGFMNKALQGKARVLRASAIYAAMREGHLDRVTLHQTMGVSIATLTKLEQLMSADLHRKLPADLVNERNKHIRGEINE